MWTNCLQCRCSFHALTPGSSTLQERLRQQIEEIKEQEANYDADAALAMAMFEHSEVRAL